jgi:hypothetical protein
MASIGKFVPFSELAKFAQGLSEDEFTRLPHLNRKEFPAKPQSVTERRKPPSVRLAQRGIPNAFLRLKRRLGGKPALFHFSRLSIRMLYRQRCRDLASTVPDFFQLSRWP